MREAVCIRKCQHQGRIYEQGETLLVSPDARLSPHFCFKDERPIQGAPLPARRRDTLLLIGDAPSMWEDIRKHDVVVADDVPPTYDVLALNRAAFRWRRPFNFWASVHGDQLYAWRLAMDRLNYFGGASPHYLLAKPWPDFRDASIIAFADEGGSAYIGFRAALDMGYPTVLVAGVSLLGKYAGFARGVAQQVEALRSAGATVTFVSGALEGK